MRNDASSSAPALELRGITKRFGALVANDRIDLELRGGEIHALLGENGAGKSTLMNVLYGLLKPDAGEILIKGEPVSFRSSADAIARGIGMVHQHFMLVPVFTVTENIVLGDEPRAGIALDMVKAEARVRELSERFGLGVDAAAKVEDISVGMQQRAEILKALYRDARVLVLDEPTAVLTPQEIVELFAVLRELRDRGTAIVLITHKLNEVLEVADLVSVLRRGVKVGTVPAAGATEQSLAELMVGREVLFDLDRTPAKPGEVALEVDGIWVRDERGLPAVRGLSLAVRAGEIVGIAGVDGNGQSELVAALAGMRRCDAGVIRIAGEEVAHASPREMFELGISHVPEDRHVHGLVLPFSLAENSVLHDFHREPASRRGWLRPGAMRERARRLIEQYDVRGGEPATPASSLSGGNQQKLVLAREIEAKPAVLLVAQPTRGLDVGAIEFVHRQIVAARDRGCAVLLVSFELDEILDLSDRILVMSEGVVVLERAAGTTDANELGLAMTGGAVGSSA